MCFSAEASFGASLIITTVGIISLKKASSKPQKLLAFIPVLFGSQQFLEGFVWLSANYDQYHALLKPSTYGFMLFAWVIWPAYIPYVLWRLEKKSNRKKILKMLFFLGLCVVSIMIIVLVTRGVTAEIQDCSIAYNYGSRYSIGWLIGILYILTTAIPNLLSSAGRTWILGLINIITYFVSRIYFSDHIISVWCFLAALSSVVILSIIIDLNKHTKLQNLS